MGAGSELIQQLRVALGAEDIHPSVAEWIRLERLLLLWRGGELRDLEGAIAALLATDEASLEAIRRVVSVTLSPPPSPTAIPEVAPPVEVRPHWVSRHGWSLALFLCAAAVVLLLWPSEQEAPPAITPTPVITVFESGVTPTPTIVEAPLVCPPEPALPLPEPRGPGLPLRLLPVGIFALVFAWRFQMRRLRHRQEHAKRENLALLNNLPGPRTFEMAPDLGRLIEREDLKLVAAALSQFPGEPTQGRRLDIRETLEQTLRSGGVPKPSFLPGQSLPRLLILLDLVNLAPLWRRRVEELAEGLRARGIGVRLAFFRGAAEYVSDAVNGARRPLKDYARDHLGPIWVLSQGAGPRSDAPWVGWLNKRGGVAFLHPSGGRGRGRGPGRGGARAEAGVLPMNRDGLIAAAWEAGAGRQRRGPLDQLSHHKVRGVTRGDLKILEQEISLLPFGEIEVLEAIRQRHYPQIPQDAIAWLMDDSSDLSRQRIRLPIARLAPRLKEARLVSKHWEEERRREILDILGASEPELQGSAAHLRWQLQVAWQRLFLHDILPDGSLGNRGDELSAALQSLRALAASPIWQEVGELMSRLGVTGKAAPLGGDVLPIAEPIRDVLKDDVLSLIKRSAREGIPRAQVPEALKNVSKPTRIWPGVRELFVGGMSGALVMGFLMVAGLWERPALPLVEDAYALSLEALSDGRGQLSMSSFGGAPLNPELYVDGEPSSTLEMIEEDTLTQALDSPWRGRWYGLRGVDDEGRVFMGSQVCLPPIDCPTRGLAPPPLPDDEAAERRRAIGLEMVALKGGCFQMGSEDGSADERPVHRVEVSPFWIGKTEVTVAQYQACVEAEACTQAGTGAFCNLNHEDRGDHPINCVDWEQARSFATWVGGRLTGEAEWEYAARGESGRTYPWGQAEPDCSLAIYDQDGSATEGSGDGCGNGSTWPVCSLSAGTTPEGLCDMAGNVWEWVADPWHVNYDGAPSDSTIWDTGSSTHRTLRGGSWIYEQGSLRSSNRGQFRIGDWDGVSGIRVAL